MPATTIPTPNVLTDPGVLFIAAIGTAHPTNTVSGGIFTDAWDVAWLRLGATLEGSTFAYSTEVEPIEVAEFFDPIKYKTTSRSGSLAFALADWSLSNYRRALNGGVAALAPTSGTGATALYSFAPPTPGSEVRCMLGWESLDSTVRLVVNSALQGGEVSMEFAKAPALAGIPCTYQMEVPSSGEPFRVYTAGSARG